MTNKLDNFLLDNKSNDKVFEDDYGNKYKLHKEMYDDRFIIIYIKIDRNNLSQSDYIVGGYLDIKNKCIYDCETNLINLFSNNSELKKDTFSSLDVIIKNEIFEYIKKYSFENDKELMNLAREEYDLDKWNKERCQSEVMKDFIKEENPTVELNRSYSDYILSEYDDAKEKNIYVNYLNNPLSTIEKFSNIIIDYYDNKKRIGKALINYYNKSSFLEDIIKNKENKFYDLYVNRNIYHSIKNMDVKTLNITITYGEKELTFKYSYYWLIHDLLNNDRYSSGSGVAYDKVIDFIKENDKDLEKRRSKDSFLYTHITSITYGKKELYHNDIAIQMKEEENDEIELEM